MMRRNVSWVGVTSLYLCPMPTASVMINQSSHANGSARYSASIIPIRGYLSVKYWPHIDTPSAAKNASRNWA
jgi:hypothetical protein